MDQTVANLSYEREQLIVIDANDTIFETQATLAISFGSLANAQGVSGTMPTQTMIPPCHGAQLMQGDSSK